MLMATHSSSASAPRKTRSSSAAAVAYCCDVNTARPSHDDASSSHKRRCDSSAGMTPPAVSTPSYALGDVGDTLVVRQQAHFRVVQHLRVLIVSDGLQAHANGRVTGQADTLHYAARTPTDLVLVHTGERRLSTPARRGVTR
jgi:hypothetical protein